MAVETMEIHGVLDGNGKHVVVFESEGWVYLQVPTGVVPGLSPQQARHLAGKLYRLARRIEARRG
jgi:hypothetical protein